MSKTNWDNVVSDQELKSAKALRSKTFITKKERTVALPDLEEDGWEKFKELKNSKFILVKKDKPFDEVFEDKVWTLFCNMGFTSLNKDRKFAISYDKQNSDFTQQIDVFAADEETILIVECKSAENLKTSNFKKSIEALHGQMQGIRRECNEKFQGRKIKFIWATQNYQMSHADLEKLKEWQIAYFSETTIDYYLELVKHLGTCARFQLLGNLFANQEIKNMDDKIPAIQGKMGGFTYYAFSIEPDKLLKIGYVLHRNEANKNMMPTYQRLIKRKRLNEVRDFIDAGGYFPNSIIISFDTDGKGVQFDSSQTKVDNAISKLGVLHIPKKYRSAYIIDGQHRLYGYSDSRYAKTNCIPIVAFVDLKREEQIKLFMDINENQKAVPKSLRVTLNADMLWDSKDFNEQRTALRSKIAQMLGEEESSPLYNRVVIGENESSPRKAITIEALQLALKKSHFFSTFGKANSIIKDGSFDKGNNEKTCECFYPFLEKCLLYIQNGARDEWNKSDAEYGMITINRGIQAIIRVIDDIVELLKSRGDIHPKTDSLVDLCEQVNFYLDPLVTFLNTLSTEERKNLRSFFGGSADTHFWRTYQKAIADIRNDFNPEGFEEFWKDQAKTFNEETRKYIRKIENDVKNIISEKLQSKYRLRWLIDGLPSTVYKNAKKEADDQLYELVKKDQNTTEVNIWDFVSLEDCEKIITVGNHWSELFEKTFSRPSPSSTRGGKKVRADWLKTLNTIWNRLNRNANYSVPSKDYQFVKEIYDWIDKTK